MKKNYFITKKSYFVIVFFLILVLIALFFSIIKTKHLILEYNEIRKQLQASSIIAQEYMTNEEYGIELDSVIQEINNER